MDNVHSLTQTLTELPVVPDDGSTFESKEDACERFKELFRDQPALVNTVDCDAAPGVAPREPRRPRAVRSRSSAVLQGQPGIDRIVDQRDFLTRLFAIVRVFRARRPDHRRW